MKKYIIILSIAAGGFALQSCSSNNGVYGQDGVYRTPDGSVYRNGDVYKDRNGNVYQYGKILTRNVGDYQQKQLPPGQAKKIYGGEAKDYAPGQQNKNSKKYKKYKKNKKDYKK